MKGRCVVFGGTGDIGGEIASQFVGAGWDVATVSRRETASVRTHLDHHVADVADEDSVVEAVRRIVAGGPLNAVVYAAGLPPDVQTSLSRYSSSAWRKTFSVYVDGLFFAYKALLPHLKAGHFLVLGSAISRTGPDKLPPINAGHYAAAKAAADAFSRWARVEANARDVLFSVLAPASVRSSAREILGIPEANSIPLERVAARVLEAVTNHREIDEVMFPE
jgi:meso-butanediol dehydrogenase/(S,S)-butanediol dehydrogenase/diacetyl reductase